MDITPLVSQLTIATKNLGTCRLTPNIVQQQYLATINEQLSTTGRVRIIVLKARQMGICLHPNTRVLNSDLQWVTIDSLYPGDSVVATDEYPPGGRGAGRKMLTTIVEDRRTVFEPAYRLTMDNGETLTATGPHRFLSHKRGATDTIWRSVDDTKVGDEIRYVTQPWQDDSTFEDGWFGGFLDGEGSLRPKSRAGVELSMVQVAGSVLDRASDYLKAHGYTFRTEVDERDPGSSRLGSQTVFKLLCGRMNELFRLMGQTRPSRFISRRWWEGKDLPGKKSGQAWAKVVSIEPLPKQRMIDLQTSSKTFIAEGFVSHNSTISEAVLFTLAFVYERYRGLIVAHEIPASQNLLKMTHLYWETYPYKFLYTPKYVSRNDLEWVETGSSIKVGTAGNKGLARSATIHFLHASEVGFWPDASDVFLGLRQTIPNVPGTGIILESTANGIGNFYHSQWVQAVEGETEYTPLFFPWHEYPEYTASFIGLPYHSLGHLDSDELALQSMGLSDDRLAWRRWAIKNLTEGDILKFRQEYPATPEEAFISTGTNVFPYHQLKSTYQPLEGFTGYLKRNGQVCTFVPDPQGPLRVFKAPSNNEWGQYFVAGDPTRTTKGDFAAAQVINRRTLEQVAIWRGRIDPGTFGEELFKLGLYYNEADLSTEKEGPGYATIGVLLGMEYPKLWQHAKPDKTPGVVTTDLYGWSTTAQTKQLMIGYLLKVVMDKNLIIHDRTTFMEMQHYVTLLNGGYGPANEHGFDDCVMALAQCVTCHMMSSPVLPYGQGGLPDYQTAEEAVGGGMLGIQLPWEQWREHEETNA